MNVNIPFALGNKIKVGNVVRPVVAYYIKVDELDMILQNGHEIKLDNKIMEELLKENRFDDLTIDTVYEIGDTAKFNSPIDAFTYDHYGLYAILENKTIEKIAE